MRGTYMGCLSWTRTPTPGVPQFPPSPKLRSPCRVNYSNAKLVRHANSFTWTGFNPRYLTRTAAFPCTVSNARYGPFGSWRSTRIRSNRMSVLLGPTCRPTRKRFRVRLKKFKACIRRPGFLEDVVRVEDVTRDGFRFVSHKLYEKGSTIQVAIPFMPDSPNIFVPAQIIRFRDLPRKKGTEYGVAYMEAPVDPPTDS